MPQEYIDQFLRVGSNTENHRTRIAIEYAKQQPMDNLVDFLEKTYHGGYGLQFGTTKVCAWYAEDGIHLAYGSAARFAKNAQILSWENVAARVGQLLERGQFATNVELAECGTFEKRQLAEQLWYMSHDISEKAIEAGHMSIVRSLRGGFPEETEKLMVFLSEPKSYQAIMRQVYAFRDACNADKGMVLTMQGRLKHQAILGSDPRGNLIRLDNALAQMPQRLKAFQTQLDETCHQQEAAKAELGKPFPFEEELRDKTARLIFLDSELNLDANKGGQTEQVIAKSARPSVLDKLRSQPAPIRNNQKQKRHEEVR